MWGSDLELRALLSHGRTRKKSGRGEPGPLCVSGAGDRIRTCNRQFTKLLRYRCVTPAREKRHDSVRHRF